MITDEDKIKLLLIRISSISDRIKEIEDMYIVDTNIPISEEMSDLVAGLKALSDQARMLL